MSTQFSVTHKRKQSQTKVLEGYNTQDAFGSIFLICLSVALFMLSLWPGSSAVFSSVGWWIIYFCVSEVLCWTFALRGKAQAKKQSSRTVQYQVSDKLEEMALAMPFLLPVSPCLFMIAIFFGAVIFGILGKSS